MLREETEGIRGAGQEVGRNMALGDHEARVGGGKGAEKGETHRTMGWSRQGAGSAASSQLG